MEKQKIDYEALGFKCGLEIHHQLHTAEKLFCHCPVNLKRRPYSAQLKRHMRPTLSELGEYDGTALMEFKTRKEVIYQLYQDSVCTYEMDDTPPFPLNQQALDIALEIALLLNCNIVDEVHISRKQYLDGSIPTGFQRTAIIGIEGYIPYKDRKIRIIQLGLEEDACREVSDIGHQIVFNTDRLSVPLVEVVTYPDMRTPQEVPEVANLIGRLLRVTGKVRRGIGVVRQDVNVSIDGGTRVEIKGVHKLQYLAELTNNEALRQKALLQIRDELRIRGINRKTFVAEEICLSPMLNQTSSKILKRALDLPNHTVYGVRLQRYGDILKTVTQPANNEHPDYTFALEISGRVKVIACLDDKPNIFNSDHKAASDLSEAEWQHLMQKANCKVGDTLVLVWGFQEDVKTAVKEILIRAQEAADGVPNETRQAFPDGHNEFERILPGPDRMYPDTDSPPTPIYLERIKQIQEQLPEPPWQREATYKEWGIPDYLSSCIAISPKAPFFEKIVTDLGIEAKLAAKILFEDLTHLRRQGKHIDNLKDDLLWDLFKLFKEKKFVPERFPELLEKLIQNPQIKPAEILKNDEEELAKNRSSFEWKKFVQEKYEVLPDKIKIDKEKTIQALISKIDPIILKNLPRQELIKNLLNCLAQ